MTKKQQIWSKIDQENSDVECMQRMIIFHMLALIYIQCLKAETEFTYWAIHLNNFYL